jgi:hypothetical protein
MRVRNRRSFQTTRERGAAVAAMLAGAWHDNPLPRQLDKLHDVLSLLLETGAGGLAFRVARSAGRVSKSVLCPLRDAFRSYVLQAALQRRHLQEAVAALRRVGIEPILAKGWSIVRLYPEPGARPSGDIDLFLPPGTLHQAIAALNERRCGQLDLHQGFPDLPDRSWATLFQRTRLLSLEDTTVRVLAEEDQLRYLCLHFWRHVGFRALWLLDIAVVLESLPENFAWDRCLAGSLEQTDWVLCVLAVAERLLGARLPAEVHRIAACPEWLAEAVLWRWGAGYNGLGITSCLRRPRELPDVLRYGWLNPIRTTLRLRHPASTSLLKLNLLSLALRPRQLVARVRRRCFRSKLTPRGSMVIHRHDVW